MCCNKFMLFATNVIVFCVGVTVVALSSIIIHKGDVYGELLFEGAVTLPVILLIFGLSVTILGFLGCFGAIRESKCMLYTYASIVLALFIGEVVLAGLLIANPEAVKNSLENVMYKQYGNYGGPDAALTATIDKTQTDLECCGVNDPNDCINEFNDVIPESCYPPTNAGVKVFGVLVGPGDPYEQGCLQAIIDEFQGITLALCITAFVLAIVMFVSLSTACSIARKAD